MSYAVGFEGTGGPGGGPPTDGGVAGAGVVPVAVKRTGGNPATTASTTFSPAVGPSVHEPDVAIPSAFVSVCVNCTEPPPVTWNRTSMLFTGRPEASLTRTAGATGVTVPAVAVWVVPTVASVVSLTAVSEGPVGPSAQAARPPSAKKPARSRNRAFICGSPVVMGVLLI